MSEMCDTSKAVPSYQVSSQPYQPPQHIRTVSQSYVPAQVYNMPATSIPTQPAIQPITQNEGWWKRIKKNKPQSNSAGSAALIFVSGGMNMAWKLGFSISVDTLSNHIICSWFIGGIIGAAVGAFACNKMSKKALLSFASVLVTICGILQATDPDSYEAILASRYLNGIAVGLVFPMTFVLLSEEVVKPLRGMNAASVDTMCFGCGVFIHILYSSSWSYELENRYPLIRISGFINIAYGVVTFIMGNLFIIESPLYYLARGDEQMAIDSLRRLQTPFVLTHETYGLLEEHKLYLAQSKERTLMQNAVYGMPALIKLCLYRSFMALGFSEFVNFAFTYSSVVTTEFQILPFILYALARFLGPLFIIFTLDFKGRKSPIIFGFIVCTVLAFSIGGIFDDKRNLIDPNSLNAVKYMLICFQLFSSMSMASSSVYLSEAFPFPIKPYYVAIVFITELLVHIIIINCRYFSIVNIFYFSEYFLTLGALSLVFLGVAIVAMPETKCLSLRECLPKFRKLNNIRD